MIDTDVLKGIVPVKYKGLINDSFVQLLKDIVKDEKIGDEFKDNFITYTSVLKDGKYKLGDYLKAVKFVTYKMLDYTDIDAYIATFPDRYSRLVKNGIERDAIGGYASRYKSTKLVSSILEQTIIPSYIINAPLYQKALTELSKIMLNSKSDMAKVNAATAILQHTKAPETKQIQLDIGLNDNDIIGELRRTVADLTNAQLSGLKAGKALKDIAESRIIDVPYEEA